LFWALDFVLDNIPTLSSKREKQQTNIDVKIMTLILPKKIVTTKLMRTTMYIPSHWNFFGFLN
jgi:hypothetical protein